jgi:hypothetical protein
MLKASIGNIGWAITDMRGKSEYKEEVFNLVKAQQNIRRTIKSIQQKGDDAAGAVKK